MNLTSGVIAIERAGFPWAWLAIGVGWACIAGLVYIGWRAIFRGGFRVIA